LTAVPWPPRLLRYTVRTVYRSVDPGSQGKGWKMTVKRKILAAFVGVLLLSGVAAASSVHADGANAAKTSKPAYNILFIGGVTGPIASSAQAILGGLRTAANFINAHGGMDGRQIKLTVENSQSDPTTAVSELESHLSGGSKPDLVYAGVISSEALALEPILTRSKILAISNANNPTLNDPSTYPYYFGGDPTSGTQNAGLNAALPKGTSLVGILAPDNASGQGTVQQVTAAIGSSVKLTVKYYDPNAVDLTVPTQALVSQHPDAIVVDGTDVQADRVLKARITVGYSNIPTYGTSGFGDQPPAQFAGAAALKNFYIAGDPGLVWQPAKSRCSAETYLLKRLRVIGTNNRIIYVPAISYDELREIAAVVNSTHKTDAGSLKTALEHFKAKPSDCFITQPARSYSTTNHDQPQPYTYRAAAKETFQDGLIRVAK
jgi:branched-chain amino acid transport system substrate-binding protein